MRDAGAGTESVTDLLAAWAARFGAETERLPDLYTQDAVFLGSTPVIHRGGEGVRAYFAGLPSLAGAKAAFTDMIVEPIAPNVASLAGFVVFTFGETARRYRITLTAVNRGGRWLFASHHVSPAS